MKNLKIKIGGGDFYPVIIKKYFARNVVTNAEFTLDMIFVTLLEDYCFQ